MYISCQFLTLCITILMSLTFFMKMVRWILIWNCQLSWFDLIWFDPHVSHILHEHGSLSFDFFSTILIWLKGSSQISLLFSSRYIPASPLSCPSNSLYKTMNVVFHIWKIYKTKNRNKPGIIYERYSEQKIRNQPGITYERYPKQKIRNQAMYHNERYP